ncbi:contractile injection system protein, VgrG/Pvc8 family [Paraburkholderia sp. BR10936]|uniref:contractile injection system protein, VgrG/Pvc8 family n=1 Tax=Paraburkholderia sp. BR10936 TaxID=3236993 RepID=UPI0034D3318A
MADSTYKRPVYRVTANGSDLTATIADRLVSLSITDETDESADVLEIVLADHDPNAPIALPPTGALLTVALGYGSADTDMGGYIVDDISLSGPPEQMTIRAKSAAFDENNNGPYHLQTQVTRHWADKTTIGAMVQKIASEHGMTAQIAASLASIQLPHTEQVDESDLNLLARLAPEYDAVVKPKGSVLLFMQRGAELSVSGQALPATVAEKVDCTTWHYNVQRREGAGTVVTKFRAFKEKQIHYIAAGSGNPVKRIKQMFTNRAEALAAAKAELRKRRRAAQRMDLTFPGVAGIQAQSAFYLSGFRSDIPARWLVSRVVHTYSGDVYRCSVDLELPNDDSDVTIVETTKKLVKRTNDNGMVYGEIVDEEVQSDGS